MSGALTDSLSSSSGLACVQPDVAVLVTVESGAEHEREWDERSGNESEPLVSGVAVLGLKTRKGGRVRQPSFFEFLFCSVVHASFLRRGLSYLA